MVVDICAARPIDLGIVDGIESMGGAEGPWGGGEGCHPGVLVAGTNCVNTDAVATAVMGFDPMAPAGAAPFIECDNFLELAERVGLGSRDLGRIEVAGTPIRRRASTSPLVAAAPPRPPYPEKKRGPPVAGPRRPKELR
jgi:uncharacterized protein (DUF362 family)